MSPYVRYIPGSKIADKLGSVRYPAKGSWTKEQAQTFFDQVDGYGRLEIIDEEDE